MKKRQINIKYFLFFCLFVVTEFSVKAESIDSLIYVALDTHKTKLDSSNISLVERINDSLKKNLLKKVFIANQYFNSNWEKAQTSYNSIYLNNQKILTDSSEVLLLFQSVKLNFLLNKPSENEVIITRLSDKIKTIKNHQLIANYYYYLSKYSLLKGDYVNAFFSIQKVESLAIDSFTISRINLIKGDIYLIMGNTELSKASFISSLNFFKKNKYTREEISCLQKIAQIYRSNEDYLSALLVEKKALYISNENQFYKMITLSNILLASDFINLEYIDSAEQKLLIASNSPMNENTELLYWVVKLQYQKASQNGNTNFAIQKIVEKINITSNIDFKLIAYKEIVDYYLVKKKWEEAFYYNKKLYELEGSLKRDNLKNALKKYTIDKKHKENEIVKLNLANKKIKTIAKQKQFYIYLILFFLFISFGLSFLIFNLYRKMKEKNSLLALQNKNILNAEMNLQITKDKLNRVAIRFQNIVENLPILVYARNSNGKIIFWNKKAIEITGYQENEISEPQDFFYLIFDDEEQRLKMQDAFKTGAFNWLETDILAKNKAPIRLAWISVSETSPIMGWAEWGIAFDISSRYQYQQYLVREKAVIQSIINSFPYSIYYKDNHGSYVGYNKAFEHHTGIKKSVIGKKDDEIFSKEKADERVKQDQLILKTGKPHYSENWEELNSNEKLLIRKEKFPILSRTKEILGVVGFEMDITKKYQFEQELQSQKEKAEKADKLKSAFLANMSHEIRTPLNAIIGFSDLLKNNKITKEQRQKYINYIDNSSNNLLNLIDDIIDTAKIEAGQLKIRKGKVFLNRLLNEIIEAHREIKNKKAKEHIKLLLEKGDDDKNFAFITDSHRLRQILSNLIGNAIKFVDEGYIKISYQLNHDEILFAIEDTGIGIPKDKQHIIFERFGQVESSYKKNFQGTGLGLAITKRLVELLGGEIWLESEENKGATFYFTLPNRITSSKEKKMPTKLQHTLNLKGKLILVVEDDVLNYTVLKSMLDVTGANHIWMKNGQKAYDYYKEKSNNIDLILLDIQLPAMNGMEFTEKVRIFDKDIPIVALSAYILKNEKEEIMGKGANDFLAKPIKLSLLYGVISKYLK